MRGRSSAALALVLLAALSIYTGTLPRLLGTFASSGGFGARYVGFPAAGMVAGILAGALFPVCANRVRRESAGKVYAADLAGAAAGALLAGLILIPSLGVYSSAFLAGCCGVLLALPLVPAIISSSGKLHLSG
jgi:predicted membrane-bound spermidine synthase